MEGNIPETAGINAVGRTGFGGKHKAIYVVKGK
jgi:hypothetical protein